MIVRTGVRAVLVGDLLDRSQYDLRIPLYQRPYSWTPTTALQLLDDITDAHRDPERGKSTYVLGAVILHVEGGASAESDVVDGQQRILTLHMLLHILDGEMSDATGDWSERAPITQVRAALLGRVNAMTGDERVNLARFIREFCEVVTVTTDDLDEAFRIFDSQNYRGKPLRPHDLLKAHHLRAMRKDSSTTKAAVVEAWESVEEHELDELFSIYLYRIGRWSRGDRATGFTVRDLDMFKGIPPESTRTPNAAYHRAAQAALPMMATLGDPSSVDARSLARSRFQLDAPTPVGRAFFEMVDFMLDEVEHLKRTGFAGEREQFAAFEVDSADQASPNRPIVRPRYRYVSELYVAGLLYYTNKFGDDRLDAVRSRLFAWAYSPRLRLQRVQYRSVDNLGSGADGDSAFLLLREAASSRDLDRLQEHRVETDVPSGENDLAELIRREQGA